MQQGHGVLNSLLALKAISCLLEMGLPSYPSCILSLAVEVVRDGAWVQMLLWTSEHS